MRLGFASFSGAVYLPSYIFLGNGKLKSLFSGRMLLTSFHIDRERRVIYLQVWYAKSTVHKSRISIYSFPSSINEAEFVPTQKEHVEVKVIRLVILLSLIN